MVIGRLAATVSSSGPCGSTRTRISAISGSHLLIGSVSASLPSSASAIAAATVTGLVIEAIRKRVSRRIGRPASISAEPISLTCSTFPRCHTHVTAPEIRPASAAAATESRLSARFTFGSLLRQHGSAPPPGPPPG